MGFQPGSRKERALGERSECRNSCLIRETGGKCRLSWHSGAASRCLTYLYNFSMHRTAERETEMEMEIEVARAREAGSGDGRERGRGRRWKRKGRRWRRGWGGRGRRGNGGEGRGEEIRHLENALNLESELMA